jgi:hypothetical protein
VDGGFLSYSHSRSITPTELPNIFAIPDSHSRNDMSLIDNNGSLPPIEDTASIAGTSTARTSTAGTLTGGISSVATGPSLKTVGQKALVGVEQLPSCFSGLAIFLYKPSKLSGEPELPIEVRLEVNYSDPERPYTFYAHRLTAEDVRKRIRSWGSNRNGWPAPTDEEKQKLLEIFNLNVDSSWP